MWTVIYTGDMASCNLYHVLTCVSYCSTVAYAYIEFGKIKINR